MSNVLSRLSIINDNYDFEILDILNLDLYHYLISIIDIIDLHTYYNDVKNFKYFNNLLKHVHVY